MAFTIDFELKIPLGGFTPGTALVIGNCEAAGVTSGIIHGLTQHVYKIACYGFTPQQNITGGAFNVVQTMDPTDGADILTLTCTAGDRFNYWYIGLDNGDH